MQMSEQIEKQFLRAFFKILFNNEVIVILTIKKITYSNVFNKLNIIKKLMPDLEGREGQVSGHG